MNATPFTYTVRTETTLEESTYLALHVNQNDGEYGIHQNDAHAYHYTFEEYRQTFRHQGSQRLVYPVGYYTKVKHLVIYNLQFTIYEALYNGNASTDYSCVAKLYIVHCKLYLPLPINIWHYVIQRSPDCNQVGNLCSAANGIYSAYQR